MEYGDKVVGVKRETASIDYIAGILDGGVIFI